MRDSGPVVIKVGGSLFDWPGLGSRLSQWLEQIERPVLVPGGGRGADIIRDLDTTHRLGEETAHDLALRMLWVNAFFLSRLLADRDFMIASGVDDLQAAWQANRIPILDAHAFALADDRRLGHLPHSWHVTSDSLAARFAIVSRAARLVLLKSRPFPDGTGWNEAANQGLVDSAFPGVVAAARDLHICWVNLRTWTP